jgi:hypothetical protein
VNEKLTNTNDKVEDVNVTGGTAFDSIMYSYRLGLGDFDTEPYN